ncbi:FxLYD domain-containing protein [Streptomyces sp. 7N604]|uniref:FxLYD domain-containing protein n=1 Tax=Streptomyces sp. 7N604 TaxID=3457415 RepID=UPI003FCFEA2A
MLATTLTGCGGDGAAAQPTATVTETVTAVPDALDISEGDTPAGTAKITGQKDENLDGEVWREVQFSLKNTTDEIHDYNVQIAFLDADGNRLAMAEPTVSNVKPGQTAHESTPVSLSDPSASDMKGAEIVDVYTVDD